MKSAKGYIFACTARTERECLDRMLFATNRVHGEEVLKLKKGDMLFLLNIDDGSLHGPFEAKSAGAKAIEPEAWKGRYPYQVRVSRNGGARIVRGAKDALAQTGIGANSALDAEQARLLAKYVNNPDQKISIPKRDDGRPRLESTTLWDYPRQSYGATPKGSNKYAGVTPAFAIYNMVRRYTEPGDTVLDPMAGSGTTIDVCKEEGRKCVAFDIRPTRPDIRQNDARRIPLADESVDMVFIDSPYGDNIDYNDHPGNIGKISAEDEEFYAALDKVMAECHRVLKPGKALGWVIGDQWVKKKFTPVGFKVYDQLGRRFETADIICLARRSQTSNTGMWHSRALNFNFYLRGFKYLFIMRKPAEGGQAAKGRKVAWKQYPR